MPEKVGSTWTVGYVYLGGALVAQYKDSTTYFVHKDHLGPVCGLRWSPLRCFQSGKINRSPKAGPDCRNRSSTRLLTRRDALTYPIPVVECDGYQPFGELDASVCTPQVGTTTTVRKFTGKERDTESGLDFFAARYYSSSIGRFTQSDPLYIELNRISDPQRLNLYSYARNNPIKYIDPLGLDISCTGERCQDYLSALQKNVSYKLTLKDGKIAVEGPVGKKLSRKESELLKAIKDDKHHVKINAVNGANDPTIFFGRSDGNGMHTIAFGQARLLDQAQNAGGFSSADLIAHETLEGYYEAQGWSLEEAHTKTNGLFGGLDSERMSAGLLDNQSGLVVGASTVWRVHGTKKYEIIKLQFVTPIPQEDFAKGKGAPYASFPADVKKVDKKPKAGDKE